MNISARWIPAAGTWVAIAVGISFLAVESIHGDASVQANLPTTTVQRGTVRATVTATGTLAPAAAVSVNFAVGGVVSEVDVKTGDQVKAGQTLAKIDDTATRAVVASAQAALTSAQANLVNAEHQAPIVATHEALAAASQVAAAQSNLDAALQRNAIDALRYQDSINQVHAQLSRDLDQYSNDQAACSPGDTTETGGGTSCAAVVAQDRNAVAAGNDAVVNAYQQQTTGQLNDEQSIQEARNNWLEAQDILASMLAAAHAAPAATSTREADAQSQVIQAQAALATAQQDEADTILTAPSDATVAAVNGVVNQTVGASSAFVILNDDSKLQIVARFAAADTNRLQVGEPATITLDPLPAQPVSGQVSAIDANTALAGKVITRNVTVAPDGQPATFKTGMSALVAILADVRDNVLMVPNRDITKSGATSSVILVHNGRHIPVEVTTGLVGDTFTEITSGLFDGETIIDTAPSHPPKSGPAVGGRPSFSRAAWMGPGSAMLWRSSATPTMASVLSA